MSLIPFEFKGASVRVHTDNEGNPWWVAKDVCDVLGFVNSSQTLTRLESDEKGVISNETLGGMQDMTTINESGLYTLILGSRKPEARQFKKWITAEVIPEIRKTGSYGIATLSKTDLALMVIESEKEKEQLKLSNEAQSQEIKLLVPKADVYDQFIDSKDAINLSTFAKTMGLKPNKTIDKLRTMGILFKREKKGSNLATQVYIDRGYFITREKVQGDKIFITTLVTPKGQEWLAKKLLNTEDVSA